MKILALVLLFVASTIVHSDEAGLTADEARAVLLELQTQRGLNSELADLLEQAAKKIQKLQVATNCA